MYLLFVCLIVIGYFPYGESVQDIPCVCDGHFFKVCPDLENCSLDISEDDAPKDFYSARMKPRATLKPDPFDFHDYDHPDHPAEDFEDDLAASVQDKIESNIVAKPSTASVKSPPRITYDGERVVRHRKVYVTERDDAPANPLIHQISITIPVKVTKAPSVKLSAPPPVYRMHKYKTYETVPETELIPVTTTIIKPVGVSQDQII